jgi:hypothetical protein
MITALLTNTGSADIEKGDIHEVPSLLFPAEISIISVAVKDTAKTGVKVVPSWKDNKVTLNTQDLFQKKESVKLDKGGEQKATH